MKNWHDYLDYEIEQGDRVRIIVLFERCLIACALYDEFWLKVRSQQPLKTNNPDLVKFQFVSYLENLKDPELQPKIRDVYERACTIHHLKKPSLHLQWAIFEETVGSINRAAEILVNLEKQVPNVLQVAYRRINLERRRADFERCQQLFEHYVSNSKNKMISSNISIKYSRFCLRVLKDFDKAHEVVLAPQHLGKCTKKRVITDTENGNNQRSSQPPSLPATDRPDATKKRRGRGGRVRRVR